MTRPRRVNPAAALPERDKPWLFRTYAGHSTATKSNELYRKNLAKGQTGPVSYTHLTLPTNREV